MLNSKGPPPPIFSRRFVASVFSLGTIFGSGLSYGYHNVIATPNRPFSIATESKYSRLHLGMSPTEARSILGPGTEISQSESSIEIAWSSPDGYEITAVFKNGKLVEKKQPGIQ